MPLVTLEPGQHQVSIAMADAADILATMEAASPVFKALKAVEAPWAVIEVIRRGVPLGTLDDVRERLNQTLP